MKVHYFQRYHSKENVATANTMLLLSRLYRYSSDKFYRFLRSELFSDSFEPEIEFNMQEKRGDSVLDAVISQDSFKIIVETKVDDWFYLEQLVKYLDAFGDENNKVLVTLASELMAEEKKKLFEQQLREYNLTQDRPIYHVNTTFESLANAINDVIDDRDYEMQEILEDYLDYCYSAKLIPVSDSWKYMRVQLAGTTLDFNISQDIYYHEAGRGFRAHDYLGLYNNKSVRAIGKVCARIIAVETDNGMKYIEEYGEITEERKQKIQNAIVDGIQRGYDLRTNKHIYFFVEKFYLTDFKKVTPRAPRGTRIFNLTQELGMEQLPDTQKIAELLKTKTWG